MTIRPANTNIAVSFNEPLKPHTTFKIGGPAPFFAPVSSPDEASAALSFARQEKVRMLVLGGGSNVLISDRGFDGLVIHPASEGIELLGSERDHVRLRIKAGEPWDRAVAHTVDQSWWGIENLSHIPGQSAAALVQNIGAYGQQLSDTFHCAEVLDLSSERVMKLSLRECSLGYRQSIFNRGRKGDFLILSVELRLQKTPNPNLSYKDVAAYFDEAGVRQPAQTEIRAAIIAIRDRKFPYPQEERGGNAGSFFKNPILVASDYRTLENRIGTRFGPGALSRLLDITKRSRDKESIRIPAALLIDICGLRGLQEGKAQVNQTQPLVILNLGAATAHDVMSLARQVRGRVFRETGVRLEIEPELVGFSSGEIENYLSFD